MIRGKLNMENLPRVRELRLDEESLTAFRLLLLIRTSGVAFTYPPSSQT